METSRQHAPVERVREIKGPTTNIIKSRASFIQPPVVVKRQPPLIIIWKTSREPLRWLVLIALPINLGVIGTLILK